MTQDTICRLEQTVADFEQYSTASDRCHALLATANDRLGDSHFDATVDADSIRRRMESLKACIYVLYDICNLPVN